MFTGPVEEPGVVVALDRAGGASLAAAARCEALGLAIRPRRIPLAEIRAAASMRHDGAGLTAVDAEGVSAAIPHPREHIHLEADILATHVEKLGKP